VLLSALCACIQVKKMVSQMKFLRLWSSNIGIA